MSDGSLTAGMRKTHPTAMANISSCSAALGGALEDGALLVLSACAEGSTPLHSRQFNLVPKAQRGF